MVITKNSLHKNTFHNDADSFKQGVCSAMVLGTHLFSFENEEKPFIDLGDGVDGGFQL